MIIALDFDGTVVEHEYPDVGAPVPGCIEWVKKFQEEGAKIMLWTMRGPENQGTTLQEAVDYLKDNGIKLWGINENPEQAKTKWSVSHKQHANIYIDDAAFGCPLVYTKGGRPYVDWAKVGPAVLEKIKIWNLCNK